MSARHAATPPAVAPALGSPSARTARSVRPRANAPAAPSLAMTMTMTLAALAALAALAPPAAAQGLPDPTRPPSEAMALVPGAAPPSSLEPRLQQVLLSRTPGGRALAVIDGETVPLNGKFKGAVLVKITDTQVVLRRGGQSQVLTLFPQPAADAHTALRAVP